LLISIGFNLFIAGWWVGSMMMMRPGMDGRWPGLPFGGPPPRPPPDDRGRQERPSPMTMLQRRLEGRLSAEGMRDVTGLLETIDSQFTRRLEASTERRNRAREILAAENFDADAFAKALMDLQAQRSTQDAELTRHIVDVIRRLSGADRKTLADVTVFIPPP
jgi:uncharacterized membrane protein